MCRNIKTLANFEPPATDEEIRASALQFVRKLSGFNEPSKTNEPAFSRAVELAPLSPRANAALARTFALAGKHDSARAVLRQLDQQAATRYVSPFEYVAVHFALGDDEKGFAWLAKSCDDRCFELLALKVDPRFETLRDDPRFVSALKRIGLD